MQPQPQAPPPPEAILFQMVQGRSVSFALGAMARLGVAEFMSAEPIPVTRIASKCGAQPAALYRVMRMLASLGVFTQSGDKFGLTAIGQLLRADSPGSLRNMAIMMTDDWILDAYSHMADSIRDGRDGVSHAYGKNAWELFREQPEASYRFQQAMTDFTQIAVKTLVESYDFAGVSTLADVGGGHGTLLAGVLKQYPSMRGVLFDLPEVIASAKEAGMFNGAGNRVRYEGGSFLETAPAGCDAYIMKHIIHDWDDDHSRSILRNIRQQMPADGRLLLYEMVVAEDTQPEPGKMLDVEMLVATVGGKERTAVEFGALLGSAGLRMQRIVPTKSPMCVIEAKRA